MNSGANKFHGFETEEQQQITENFEIARKNAYIIVQCCNGEMLRKAIDNFKIASRSIIDILSSSDTDLSMTSDIATDIATDIASDIAANFVADITESTINMTNDDSVLNEQPMPENDLLNTSGSVVDITTQQNVLNISDTQEDVAESLTNMINNDAVLKENEKKRKVTEDPAVLRKKYRNKYNYLEASYIAKQRGSQCFNCGEQTSEKKTSIDKPVIDKP